MKNVWFVVVAALAFIGCTENPFCKDMECVGGDSSAPVSSGNSCLTCSDMLAGFEYNPDNICTDSLMIWKKLAAPTCYQMTPFDVPCYQECKLSLCIDTQAMTEACLSCIENSGVDKLESRLSECEND